MKQHDTEHTAIDSLYRISSRVSDTEEPKEALALILQAIITSDGSVGQIEVLRTNRPNMGFEDAAILAVTEWRYKPALQNGRPVEVYFTVFVDFKLH